MRYDDDELREALNECLIALLEAEAVIKESYGGNVLASVVDAIKAARRALSGSEEE